MRNHLLRAAFAAIAASGLGACAIAINLPANRFDSPETRGQLGKGHVDPLILQGANQLVLVPDITEVPAQTQPSFERSGAGYRFGVGLGILENLDLDVKLQTKACGMLQAKYQILGEPELRAKEGNFSLAVTAAYGSVGMSGSASDSLSNVNANYDVTFNAFDLALIAGRRLSDSVLLYGGPFFTSVNYSGTLGQTGASTATYDLAGNANQSGINLGLQFGSDAVFFKVEEALAHASASDSTQTGLYTGLLLGVRW